VGWQKKPRTVKKTTTHQKKQTKRAVYKGRDATKGNGRGTFGPPKKHTQRPASGRGFKGKLQGKPKKTKKNTTSQKKRVHRREVQDKIVVKKKNA